MYKIKLMPGWDDHYKKFDKNTQEIILNKIEKQQQETKTRHLKYGLVFFVAECGQNRIALKINEQEQTKEIWFVGNHKQYDRWRKSQK